MAQMGDGDGCVIRLHEVIDCDDKLILVLDFAQFGEIMSWNEDNCTFETCLENKKFFKEEDIQRIMRDCLIGLDYLHTNNMVHRDIKPQNIMLDEIGKSKYGDFGTSIVLPYLTALMNFLISLARKHSYLLNASAKRRSTLPKCRISGPLEPHSTP